MCEHGEHKEIARVNDLAFRKVQLFDYIRISIFNLVSKRVELNLELFSCEQIKRLKSYYAVRKVRGAFGYTV